MNGQGVALDRGKGQTYIDCALAAVLVLGCQPGLEPLAPADLTPATADQVAEWVAVTVPASRLRYDVRWSFQQHGSAVGGRGAARIAPPDSVRLDFQGPLGLGAGSAVVMGREVRWAEPERNFQDLLEAIPLLWAALGMALAPEPGERLAGRDGPNGLRWRYVTGPDKLLYVREQGSEPRFTGELRRAGRVVGRASVLLDPITGLAREARLDLPHARARLDLDFRAAVADELFPPETWVRAR